MADENSAIESGSEETAPEAQGADAIERGTYEIIRDRLKQQARDLQQRTQRLNDRRLETFGGTELAVVGNERIRTENNCIPRDIARVGDRLLFGYNVFFGLKRETAVDDVFSCHRFIETEADEGGELSFTFEPAEAGFLEDPGFRQDFRELYQYYKSTRLLQLRSLDAKVLAVFQIGGTVHDSKVLRWAVDSAGEAAYIDNRGERDHVFAPAYDFDWTPTTREDHVAGRHPHVDILGKVYVETVGGDLTIKVENNTEDGLGIYREPVADPDQSLDDAEVHYAELGPLILLKILPFREEQWRYLVFNTRTRAVERIDAIGIACQRLPEDHGIVFPGGYYLLTGQKRIFESAVDDLEFARRIRSPNGEDVLYVFHNRGQGRTLLLPYNLIRKEVAAAIHCNGWALFPSGRMVIFRATSEEPTRVHAMQIWQTPFQTTEFAASQTSASAGSYLERIGNADLVRGISDAFSLTRSIDEQEPSIPIYEAMIQAAEQMIDAYHWLGHDEAESLGGTVAEIQKTAELILAEFEKVEVIRAQSSEALAEAEARIIEIKRSITPRSWSRADQFVDKLGELRRQRGQLVTLRDLRYIDLEKLDELEAAVVEEFEQLSSLTVDFMRGEKALEPYHAKLDEVGQQIEAVTKVAEVSEVAETLDHIDDSLRLLSEIIAGLEIDDATVRTELLEGISEVLAGLNRTRALLEGKRKSLRSTEAVAEFGAEFKLFSQSVTGAINMATSPEDCDSGLARLMVSIEELESRYADFDEFIAELTTKREEVYEAFSSKKQQLLDQRQRRAQQLINSAERILDNVTRRSSTFQSTEELNTYFASDPMVGKVRDLATDLRELGSSVKADEIESALKSARQEAARRLRDRQDIFEEGAEVIRLGHHRFSVNTQPVDLTLVPREDEMFIHLTGTDFYEKIDQPGFEDTRPYWSQILISETAEVYRAEYLAASLLFDAEEHQSGLSLAVLHAEAAAADSALADRVKRRASERYDEGYERGVHDHDATLILHTLLQLESTAGLLRYPADARALACLYWGWGIEDEAAESLRRRAQSLHRLKIAFGPAAAHEEMRSELAEALEQFREERQLGLIDASLSLAAAYLLDELGRNPLRFSTAGVAVDLAEAFRKDLRERGHDRDFEEDLRKLEGNLVARLQLARAWLQGYSANLQNASLGEKGDVPEGTLQEAAVLLLGSRRIGREPSHTTTRATVEGLLGQHPRMSEGTLEIDLDEFLDRLDRFRRRRVPGFREYQERRHDLLEAERYRLRLSEYRPRVMSAFVRNKLIDQVYLPIVGDNLAKQIGALGAAKRTDQMGLLLLISPPGYGKTTLMEYIANRLGLVFMKINGPALGHSVTSLDPADAPNATARQEVEKINLAFEMGNNVLLYVDDIQHTSSEFLQKFISLCDAQRRIEGVWKGRTRTYDLRGKRFAVCMGGNPYTESGEVFQIPDMLANRADTYNLGDVLTGKEELFELSYLENSLTSNPVLAPLGSRDPEDLYKLVRMASGEVVQADQLEHPYSTVELEEILTVLRHLLRAQEVILAVNRTYIESASQDDAYRTEPPFGLQGSYRNMNKLAEKIVPVMNRDELEALLDDHYLGEAQTLTTGAEHNLLKLKELRGVLTAEEAARWEEIKRTFNRMAAMGGDEDDPVTRVTGTLGLLSERLSEIGRHIETAAARAPSPQALEGAREVSVDFGPYLEQLNATVAQLGTQMGSQLAAQRTETAMGSQTTLDPAVFEAITDKLSGLARGLEAIGGAIDSATRTRPAAGASAQQVRVIQTLQSGVHDLLEDLVETIDKGLMESLRGVDRWLERQGMKRDPRLEDLIDRTLSGLDQLKDLAAALKKIDTRSLVSEAAESKKPK